ncbi:hypothetical protein JKG47_22470 [Acidithiobacillus sp. MC6.1]|nr:hypothetical protein [Acidithiobacillus sp. MC6.1]
MAEVPGTFRVVGRPEREKRVASARPVAQGRAKRLAEHGDSLSQVIRHVIGINP